jgi:hypothetical protein
MKTPITSLLRLTLACLLTAIAGQTMAGGLVELEFDWANDFVAAGHDPLDIDNMYWPLIPNTVFTYTAESEDGCELNIMSVLPGQRNWGDVDDDRYDGIRGLVAYDVEYLDEECEDNWGDPTEVTFDWYAQDASNNIWYLGEDTVSFDHEGECDNWVDDTDPPDEDLGCADGSFEAGVDGAEAGIVMLGSPSKGAFYAQEFYEDQAEDWGKVLNYVPVSTDFGDWEECLRTKEWTPLEPGSVEHKYYCAGTGLVLVEELQGKTKWVELVDISALTP